MTTLPSKAYCCPSDGLGPDGGLPDYQIVETSIAYLSELGDDVILATGTFTVSLPPVATAKKIIVIKSVLGGGSITVDPDGAETIEGMANQVLTAGTAITISPSSDGWLIV